MYGKGLIEIKDSICYKFYKIFRENNLQNYVKYSIILTDETRKFHLVATFHTLKLGGINMARINFYEQISDFIRENKHLGARFVRTPTENPCVENVAVVCDRLEDFVIPDGLKIEGQKGRYWLRSCCTGEFLAIINKKNESKFFKKASKKI